MRTLTDRSVSVLVKPMCPVSKAECAAYKTLLASATRLFAEHGYHGVSVNQVAQTASVSKANVFHHFPNKEALFLAALRDAADRSTAAMAATLEGEGDFGSKLGDFLGVHLEGLNEDEIATRLILRAFTDRNIPVSAQTVADQLFTDSCQQLIQRLAASQEAGDWRDDLSPAFVMFLLLAGNSYLFQTRHVLRHLPGGEFADDPARFAQQAAEIFWNGLRPRG